MSNAYNDRVEEQVYEAGYEKGFADCQSELTMKIHAVLRYYLYTKGTTALEISQEIGKILEGVSFKIVESD